MANYKKKPANLLKWEYLKIDLHYKEEKDGSITYDFKSIRKEIDAQLKRLENNMWVCNDCGKEVPIQNMLKNEYRYKSGTGRCNKCHRKKAQAYYQKKADRKKQAELEDLKANGKTCKMCKKKKPFPDGFRPIKAYKYGRDCYCLGCRQTKDSLYFQEYKKVPMYEEGLKKKVKVYREKHCEPLSDEYIISLLLHMHFKGDRFKVLSKEDITPELIELKRKEILLGRESPHKKFLKD